LEGQRERKREEDAWMKIASDWRIRRRRRRIYSCSTIL
jgi:hypothetical protein